MNQNRSIFSKYKKLRSSWLFVCLFLLATVIHPVVAEVSALTPSSMESLQSNSPQNWGVGGANKASSNNPSQLVKQAQALYKEQNYKAAIPLWQQAVESFAQAGDSLNQAIALSNLSLTQQQLGQWEAAEKAIAESLKLLNSIEESDSVVIAQTLDIQGKLQRETGKSAKAVETWQEAAEIYQEQDNSAALAQNNLNQVQALQDLGLYPRACKRLLNTIALDSVANCKQLNQLNSAELESKLKPLTSKPSATTISALRSLGDLLLITGQPRQSEQILAASLSAAQKLDVPPEIATTYLSVGNTYQALAEGEEVRSQRRQYEQQATEAYRQAASISASPAIKLKAQLNQLNFLIKQEKWSEAEPLWRSLLDAFAPRANARQSSQDDDLRYALRGNPQDRDASLYPQVTNRNLPNSRDNLYARINYGQNAIKLMALDDPAVPAPSTEKVSSILVDAADRARILGDNRLEAYAWGSLGRLNEVTGEYPAAEIYTQQALNLISNYDASDIAYQYFWQLGRVEKKLENTPQAIASYTKAYDALQTLRSDLATINPEVQFSFRDEVEPVYRELVELDVKYAQVLNTQGNTEESRTRLIQARDVVESLQVAQLNNFFREACIDANPQVIDAIDPTAAVVYPIILEDELEILLSLPNQAPRLYSSDVSQVELEDTVAAINKSLLSSAVPVESLLPQYQQVYNWLIQPLETELAKNEVKTIAFVLDGGLRNIPMSVLYDGEQYLVEKYALALTPGLQLLDPKPLTALQLDAVTGGLSELRPDFEPHTNFGDLPKVPEELATIRQVGLAKNSLLNSEFTKAAIKQKITASDSPIVHLATHAKFSSKAEDTFILSWDGQINIKDLDDLLRDDTFNRKNDIELLVLSACETASGDPRATLGLAGVAVQAGARSTLATLWSVVDESTAQIMGEFYRQLEKSTTTKANKAEVLRQAQIALMNGNKFNHPHFWAPFVLVGNWQ